MPKNLRGRWFRIRTPNEETQCPECGYPLYVGDRAFENRGAQAILCSPACARKVPAPLPLDYPGRARREAS
jgi:hypothetical protein